MTSALSLVTLEFWLSSVDANETSACVGAGMFAAPGFVPTVTAVVAGSAAVPAAGVTLVTAAAGRSRSAVLAQGFLA